MSLTQQNVQPLATRCPRVRGDEPGACDSPKGAPWFPLVRGDEPVWRQSMASTETVLPRARG